MSTTYVCILPIVPITMLLVVPLLTVTLKVLSRCNKGYFIPIRLLQIGTKRFLWKYYLEYKLKSFLSQKCFIL